MRTVTAAFIAALQEVAPAISIYVDYKRRYWDIETQSYVYESNWTTLPTEDVLDPGRLVYELDIKRSGDYKTPNLTLKLVNDINQWKSDNDTGKFKPDTISVVGYVAYLTKFRIRIGVELTDHSIETITYWIG